MSTNLKQGDIIVFKAEDSWLSKAIAKLTNSNVCHAAMVYSEDCIVELGASGIGVNKVETGAGESIYVMRLSPEKDPAPLIAAAGKYLDAKITYDFSGLFLLAGLLIHKRITPTGRVMAAINHILMAACLKLDKYMEAVILHHEERGMVCSQLVYQIYEDCGSQYHIRLTGNIFSNEALQRKDSVTICLADMISDDFASAPDRLPVDGTDSVTEEVIKELYLALVESEGTNQASKGNADATLPIAARFLHTVKKLYELTGSSIPLDAMFVAPCDFVYHADNLDEIGTLEMKRVPNLS